MEKEIKLTKEQEKKVIAKVEEKIIDMLLRSYTKKYLMVIWVGMLRCTKVLSGNLLS